VKHLVLTEVDTNELPKVAISAALPLDAAVPPVVLGLNQENHEAPAYAISAVRQFAAELY